MDPWLQLLLTIFGSVVASSGFWAFISAREARKHNQDDLLLGLAHDRIMSLCQKYIKRGWITVDEHENLIKYLYKPYKHRGGNGTAEQLVAQVNRLPMACPSDSKNCKVQYATGDDSEL